MSNCKKRTPKPMTCPYCKKSAVFLDNAWVCKPCNAMAKVDPKSRKRLSVIANEKLRSLHRDLTKKIYSTIDLMVVCGYSKTKARSIIIKEINKKLSMKMTNTVVQFLDETTCKRIMNVVSQFKLQVKPICPYCSSKAQFIAEKSIFRCDPCDAQVGIHKSNNEPLGTLANPPLRRARMDAHSFFDPLWKYKMKKDSTTIRQARKSAYQWLADSMEIHVNDCHIAMFNIEQCQKVQKICQPYVARALRNINTIAQ